MRAGKMAIRWPHKPEIHGSIPMARIQVSPQTSPYGLPATGWVSPP